MLCDVENRIILTYVGLNYYNTVKRLDIYDKYDLDIYDKYDIILTTLICLRFLPLVNLPPFHDGLFAIVEVFAF